MKELIEIFRMEEIKKETRARLIIKLGRGINDQMGTNLTEAVVYELVSILEPTNKILQEDHYLFHAGLITLEEYTKRLKNLPVLNN